MSRPNWFFDSLVRAKLIGESKVSTQRQSISIIPEPQKMDVGPKRFRLNRIGVIAPDNTESNRTTISDLMSFLAKLKLEKSCVISASEATANFDTILYIGTSAGLKALPPGITPRHLAAPKNKPEGYALSIDKHENKTIVILLGDTPQARYHAFTTFKQLILRDNHKCYLPQLTIGDWPSFNIRAIIVFPREDVSLEKLEQDLILIPENKFNLMMVERYYWDFPHRRNPNWSFFKPVIKFLRNRFVETCIHIAPLGGPISDKNWMKGVLTTLDTLYETGCRWFNLDLSDLNPTHFTPPDRKAFNNLAEAHLRLIMETYRYLKKKDKRNILSVKPSVNCTKSIASCSLEGQLGTIEELGIDNLGYLRELGVKLPEDIPMLWTGPYVRSPVIKARDADYIARILKRKPFVFDTNPEVEGYKPLEGRSKNLGQHVFGHFLEFLWFSNSRIGNIPALSSAGYFWNSNSYSPQKYLSKIALKLVGVKECQTLVDFISHLPLYIMYADTRYINDPSERITPQDIDNWVNDLRVLNKIMHGLKHKITDPQLRAEMEQAVGMTFDRIRAGRFFYDYYPGFPKTKSQERLMQEIVAKLKAEIEGEPYRASKKVPEMQDVYLQ